MKTIKHELDLVYTLAEAWNKLDYLVIKPFLANKIIYTSQNVFEEMEGKSEVSKYLRGKMETIKRNPAARVYAEIGFCGGDVKMYENKPCVVLAQGRKDNILGLLLIKVESKKIKQIDVCSAVPHPSRASRTGIYPGE